MKDILRGLNIYLIGMMGAGKSTVGELLAEQLGYRFLDTDSIIETVSKKSINEIFVEVEEAGFRKLEADVLMQISGYIRTVISTGGGIILRRENWSYLRDGMIIWLDVPTEVLVKRLAQDQTRPLLQAQDLKEKLTNLKKERESLYQQADIIIQVTQEDQATDVAQRILEQIPGKIKHGF